MPPLILVSQVDHGADPVRAGFLPTDCGQRIQRVGANHRPPARLAFFAGWQATEIPNVEAALPVQMRTSSLHWPMIAQSATVSIASPVAWRLRRLAAQARCSSTTPNDLRLRRPAPVTASPAAGHRARRQAGRAVGVGAALGSTSSQALFPHAQRAPAATPLRRTRHLSGELSPLRDGSRSSLKPPQYSHPDSPTHYEPGGSMPQARAVRHVHRPA